MSPVLVVVIVGLEGDPLLDLDELGGVAQDVSQGSLEDFLLGHRTQSVGVDVGVEETVAVLQSLEL
jgi:hypothetical protein